MTTTKINHKDDDAIDTKSNNDADDEDDEGDNVHHE